MINKIDHIGLVVNNLEETVNLLTSLLGVEAKYIQNYPGLKVALLQIGDVTLEPMQPTDDSHPMSQFLKKHGNGISHVAFEVDDVDKELQTLAAKGVKLTDQKGRIGITGKIGYLHPSSTNEILIELVQKTDGQKT